MKTVCIDTHALVWYLSKPKKLARSAARILRDADVGRATVLVPAIVAIELSMIRELGRKTPGVPELEALLAMQPAFEFLPLDLEQAKEFAAVSSIADPFDRMVVAAARAAQVPLITADEEIQESSLVDVVWD